MKLPKLKLNKRGVSIGEIPTIAIVMTIAIVATSVGALILGQVQGTMTGYSYEYNVTYYGLTAMLTFATWFGTILIIVAAVIVISLLFKLRGSAGV